MANRAWLYCRVGGGHKHEAEITLSAQELRLSKYCEEQGLQVVGATKTVGKGQTELERLVDEGVAQDSFDFLVSNSVSRLGRNIMDVLSAAHKLEEHGIGLCLVQEGICTLPIHGNDMEMGGFAL